MKHLQKLPRNNGDNIFLGTLVAIGIQSGRGEFFASFDNNGELVTYLIEEAALADELIVKFKNQITDYFGSPGLVGFNDLTARCDLRYLRIDGGCRVVPVASPEGYFEIRDNASAKPRCHY